MMSDMNSRAVALARESVYTAEAWTHALNALGPRTDELLPAVKTLVAQGRTPYRATVALMSVCAPLPLAPLGRWRRTLPV